MVSFSKEDSFAPPGEIGVFVVAPFDTGLIVDHRALALRPQLPQTLAERLKKRPPSGVAEVVFEVPEPRRPEFSETRSRLPEPESMVRLQLMEPLDLLSPMDTPDGLLVEPARLSGLEVYFDTYRAALLTGWVRVRLSPRHSGTQVAGLLHTIGEKFVGFEPLERVLSAVEERVCEEGGKLLNVLPDYESPFEPPEKTDPAAPTPTVRWCHTVAIWQHDGGLREEEARRYARDLVILHDRNFEDMCPSSDDFVYIGWLRSVLVGRTSLDELEAKALDASSELPALRSLTGVRWLMLDWLAADRLNNLLAKEFKNYSRERSRLSPQQIRKDMERIERITLDAELYENAKSRRQQRMSPPAYQVYEGASWVWRVREQQAGYTRALRALGAQYEQAKTELEVRARRSTERLLAVLSAIVLISAVYDAWELMGQDEFSFDPLKVGTRTLLLVLLLVAFLAGVFWRRFRA